MTGSSRRRGGVRASSSSPLPRVATSRASQRGSPEAALDVHQAIVETDESR